MKKIILIIFAGIFSITVHYTVFADKSSELCQKTGYTVSAINGIFTDEEEARNNQRFLKAELKDTYNGEKIDYQYLLNPSHIAGLGDLTMSFYQKIFDYEAVKDYDLVEMLKDASEKVKTQKLLLVAHSQGNFYANSFYDSVAGKDGGVPQESIGVYAVATPAGRVAGKGKWLTSDTDKVIVDLVGLFPFKKIMAPNTSIVLTKGDDFKGHNFSGVYLKYRGKEIISDIRETLGRLAENNVQSKESPCLAPPKLTLAHKIQGEILSAVDPFANMTIDGIVIVAVEAYQAGKALAKGVASLSGLIAGAYDSVLPEDNKNTNNETVFFDVIKPENFSSLSAEEAGLSALPTGQAGEEAVLSINENAMSRSRLDIAEEALKVLQNQILSLKNQAIVSSESITISRLNLDIVQDQPKFVAAIYPGFGGGGDGGAFSVSSLSASSAVSSSSAGSSAPAPDTTPPELSLVISECQTTLSSDGCLAATTTLNIAWNSPSSDLDYFILNNNGSVSTTTATSTIAIASDNTVFSFSVSAKDLTGNFSATSTQMAEISTMPVVINEVAWAGNSAAYSADEWIELYNRTNKSVNLSDWILYSATNLSPYVVLTGVISAKGYYLLERTNDNTVSDISADKIYTGALNNSGENLILSYASSTIDEISHDSNWYAGSDFNYSSMERYDASSAGTSSSNWGTNNTIIKNGKNAGNENINGTPKTRNSANYLINRGQNIYSNLTLSASSSPYLVNNNIQIVSASSTLTIEPGVVIKFYYDAGLSFNNGAKILAQGSAASPIIFTSFYDDNYGGDTNGDGTSTSPAFGQWFGVRIDSPGTESIIRNTIFRYGGGWTDSKANLYIANSSAVVSDSVFEYSKVYGLKMVYSDSSITNSIFRNNNNSLDTAGYGSSLFVTGGSPTVSGSSFASNHRGAYFFNSPTAVDSNIFTDNTGEAIYSAGRLGSYSGNSGSNNSINGIVISGNITTANSTTTLGVNSLPYIIKTYDATVAANSALVIPSGVVLKADRRLYVNGNLNIIGSSSGDVILTSLYDDTAGGDAINNDSTAPQAGNGGWIVVSGTGNFAGSGFTARYGGSHAYGENNSAWLSFDGSGGSISNALFDNNYPHGIYAANSSGLIISDTSFSNHSFNGAWGTKSALSTIASTITLSAVSFTNNALGVLSSISTFIASNVTFTNNTATTSPGGLW